VSESIISYGRQWLDDDDIASVVGVLKSDYLTCGPVIEKFEKALADFVGAKYCVAVANGTAALHLAVMSLGFDGGEGITTPITFAASANCLLYNGLKAVFADIDKNSHNIDPLEIEKKITAQTRLIIPVHFAGRACDMEKIAVIAQKNNLKIIEDAAHAIGSKYSDGSRVGNCKYSDLTIFSFHPVKTITTGEGGAITINDENLYKKLLTLRSHGITRVETDFINKSQAYTHDVKNSWYYEMQDLGFNYRLTDIQAALGCSQLSKLDNFIKRRSEIIDFYNRELKELDWLQLPLGDNGTFSAFHLFVVLIDYPKIGKSRQQVMDCLLKENIGTQVHYLPVYLHPYYQQNGYNQITCPVAEAYYAKALSLPLYPKMSDDDALRVVKALKNL